MAIPDKVKYTNGEKAAEIITAVLAAAFIVTDIILFNAGTFGGETVIMIVVTLIIYGAFGICSVYPQGSNILHDPEKATDAAFHKIRKGCIAAKAIFATVLFLILFISFIVK